MARRKSKGRRSSRSRGVKTRSATRATRKRTTQKTIIIETRGRGPKRTTIYEDVYEEEW